VSFFKMFSLSSQRNRANGQGQRERTVFCFYFLNYMLQHSGSMKLKAKKVVPVCF
jgi:hypothetical protein